MMTEKSIRIIISERKDFCRRIAGESGVNLSVGVTNLPAAVPGCSWVSSHHDGVTAAPPIFEFPVGTVETRFLGAPQNLSYSFMTINRRVLEVPRFECLRHDIILSLYVEVDEIHNLASQASPVHFQFDPVQTVKTSVHGSIDMLRLAERPRAPIVRASAIEVYGDPEAHPQTEGYWGRVNPIGPRACYDAGERCAEALFLITTVNTASRSGWCAYSTRMARTCFRMTEGPCRISSSRPCATRASPFSMKGCKPGVLSTWMTWSRE